MQSSGAGRGARRSRTASGRRGRDRFEVGEDGEPREPAPRTPPADPEATARNVCLRMLERKARSRSELEQALHKREISDDVARRVLDRFAEVGLVDDAALAESMAGAQHRERGLARRAVSAKLKQRGFDDEVIESAVTGIDAENERVRALELATRRLSSLRGLAVEVQTRRLIGLLARKGYPSAMVYDVVREVLRAAAEVDDGVAGETADDPAARPADGFADDFYDASI